MAFTHWDVVWCNAVLNPSYRSLHFTAGGLCDHQLLHVGFTLWMAIEYQFRPQLTLNPVSPTQRDFPYAQSYPNTCGLIHVIT